MSFRRGWARAVHERLGAVLVRQAPAVRGQQVGHQVAPVIHGVESQGHGGKGRGLDGEPKMLIKEIEMMVM